MIKIIMMNFNYKHNKQNIIISILVAIYFLLLNFAIFICAYLYKVILDFIVCLCMQELVDFFPIFLIKIKQQIRNKELQKQILLKGQMMALMKFIIRTTSAHII